MSGKKKAIIFGAGPAGLTAAYELSKRTSIQPVIYEMSSDIGGISKTINYKGNRIDLGGHRFFSKSDIVMDWWQEILPIQGSPSRDHIELEISYRNKKRPVHLSESGPDPEKTDNVMLIRSRLSRIYFLRKFFDYPISLNFNTLYNLGIMRIIKIGLSYTWIQLFPRKKEISLEDFLINRFGKELYLTFFKDYTQKVWGMSCDKISSEWGAQRIKGLSISKAVGHYFKSIFRKQSSIEQKKIETTLIEQFMYPKYGPGHLWEVVAQKIKAMGGEIHMNMKVMGIHRNGDTINEIEVENCKNGKREVVSGDYFFSTMPVKDLIAGISNHVPDSVKRIANGLIYRDFVTIGLLCKRLKIENTTKITTINNIVPDNWIYIQERDVKVGRLQIFNNWSPYMVADGDTVWLGLEYFCNEGDELWNMPDREFMDFAIGELAKIDIISSEDVLDSTIIRMPKTYPAYFGTYNDFEIVKEYTKSIENLFLIGRNGMHKYNNQDHSMLTAITAVNNIIEGINSKENIWNINTEEEYHEEK